MTTRNCLSSVEATCTDDVDSTDALREGYDLAIRVLYALNDETENTQFAVYDLPKVTGLNLADSFTLARALEFDRMVRIDDDPTDPFGARMTLLDEGIKYLNRHLSRRSAVISK